MKIAFLISLLFSINAFAHGEDSPGPHNGYIKMLGAFHVEAAQDTDGSFHVFLLDVAFKNPVAKNSSVELSVKQKAETKFTCEIMGNNHFHCVPPKKTSLDRGKLIIKANREGATGEAQYNLPLKWKTSTPEAKPMDHSNH